MSQSNTAEKFQVLSERDHILLRPGMYVGSTSVEPVSGLINGTHQTLNVVPALLKIINEILDNAVDEFIRTGGKFANKIDINIQNRGMLGPLIDITDNGRGIPVKKIGEHYQPTLAWCKARAGTNFEDDANRTTMGMNGVGSFCTNVFSTRFQGETYDGKMHLKVDCKDNGEIVSEKARKKNSGTTFTKVTFSPDLQRLGAIKTIDQDHITYIEDRLQHLAASFSKLHFTLNGKKIVYKNLPQLAKLYSDTTIRYEDNTQKLVIANSGDDQEFRFVSHVNGLTVKNGGSHLNYILDAIIDDLRPLIKRKYKIEVLPNHIKQHMLVVSYITGMKNMKFDSQTKERITNTTKEVSTLLGGDQYKSLAKKIMSCEDIIEPIIQAQLAKKELAERLALARQQKKAKKVNVVNHIAAQGKDPEKNTLFITEGLSAIGQLLTVRDPKIAGGYPLKGKILNTRSMKPLAILKNKEISELLAIIGLEFNKPAKNLNYGKIAILTDADVDGSQIACLLINLFSHWRGLFDEGRISIVKTPLVIATKGKQTKTFYTLDEFKNAKLMGWDVDYCKGLGTLSTDLYREIINNPVLVKVSYDNDSDAALETIFGKDAEKRKKWLTQP